MTKFYSFKSKWLLVPLVLFTISVLNAWGTTYTITFATASSTDGTAFTTSETISNIASAGASNIKSLNTCTNVYKETSYGIKLGKSGGSGTFKFTLSDALADKIVRSVTIKSVRYGSDTGTLTATATGTNSPGTLGSGVSPGTDIVKDYTAESTKKITTIQISTSSKRAYISEIVIETIEASCSADVAIGDASLNGSFNLSSVGVQCASITVGSNCAVTANNYGFIWYEGTGDKEIGGSGVTRVNNTTAYSSGSFSNTLSSTFVAGTTYTFRAFAINDKPSTAYSAAVSFTPYTVTFNINGHGSAPSQQVVNTGGTASQPSNPSATGYNFGGWYQEAGCTNAWNFSTTITSSNTTSGNRNLYAKWTANPYTITLNDNGGSGGDGTHAVTYNAATGSLTNTPTKTGYDFGGYWTSSNSGVTLTTQVFGANLAPIQNVSGYTDNTGDKKWINAGNVTLYAKWTAKSFTVTWMVNGESYSAGGSTSVNFDSHVATLPTAPTPPCGNKFMGWTTTNIGSVGLDKDDDAAAITALNLFTTAGDAPTVTAEGNVTYYAVFADYAE